MAPEGRERDAAVRALEEAILDRTKEPDTWY
jgi:hypothetical protein